jgi:hypothetical protein
VADKKGAGLEAKEQSENFKEAFCLIEWMYWFE